MADWTLGPVQPASLATAALQRDPRDRPRDPNQRRHRPRASDSPGLLERLLPGTAIDPYELDVEVGPTGELLALVIRERDSGRTVRRVAGAAVEALLREPGSPGQLMERSG